ncbi:hypothetical protein [Spirosoma pollinicola]|uniref:Uncharacterized protein n=1 Tax=Spirosoma pollinicola TaxID=2057025 RepID=A0A2K8Z2R6_9BACT|nr:hypothetical protein [Spirosoma pollinicola]AUD04124.1 hypothetical protein CWM47_21190 [Spirosoma pollinicola]
MSLPLTTPHPGFYQYTYPTFVDAPQPICVHFLTPDGQQAFVSYPSDRSCKVAQLIPVSWFQSVTLSPQNGQPQLMPFLDRLFTKEADRHAITRRPGPWVPNNLKGCNLSQHDYMAG